MEAPTIATTAKCNNFLQETSFKGNQKRKHLELLEVRK